MGSRGPVPKRAEERAGHRTKSEQPDRLAVPAIVKAPPASSSWAPEARAWYRALTRSGQSRWYEPSDWAYARLLARLLSDQLGAEKMSSEMVKAVLSAMSELGTTEGSRRRMGIEIDRPKPGVPAGAGAGAAAADPAAVAVMEQYRRLSGG